MSIIKSVVVEGLHDQFDIELHLNPGLNIIYGKNGRGKTTILHLLANAIELDFQRFESLRFRRIEITNFEGTQVAIAKDESGVLPTVSIDGTPTSFSNAKPSLDELEKATLRKALGGLPTYLPAFRSVLERTRGDVYATSYIPAESREEIRLLAEKELHTQRGYDVLETNRTMRSVQSDANSTAQKTYLCRQWFGKFVPIIRYPSVADVEDGLANEWADAELRLSWVERRMYEETFADVLDTLTAYNKPQPTQNNDDLLKAISTLLSEGETTEEVHDSFSRNVSAKLTEAVSRVNFASGDVAVANALLDVYRKKLERRNSERRSEYQRSRDFESSVNRFLDTKALRIGRTPGIPPGAGRRSHAVRVMGQSGQSYSLTALSSGERHLVTMLYSASRTRFLDGLFLIDEPELSLHIDWQRIILSELQKQVQGRQIIACTHAPEVGADHFSALHHFEPRLTQGMQPPQKQLFSEGDE